MQSQPQHSSCEDDLLALIEYGKSLSLESPSHPSFPPPQTLDDVDDPPIWPAWNRRAEKFVPPQQTAEELKSASSSSSSSASLIAPSAVNHFEAHIANLFGKHAALFLPSSGGAITGSASSSSSSLPSPSSRLINLITLKTHSHGRNAIFACLKESNGSSIMRDTLRSYEVLGFSALNISSPAVATDAVASSSAAPAASAASSSSSSVASSSAATSPPSASSTLLSSSLISTALNSHWKKPSCIMLDLPLCAASSSTSSSSTARADSCYPPFSELQSIRAYTRTKEIRIHVDLSANSISSTTSVWRLNEIYHRSYQEIASQFDSLYITFGTSNTNGFEGGMLLGTEEFIQSTRSWCMKLGGLCSSAPASTTSSSSSSSSSTTSSSGSSSRLIDLSVLASIRAFNESITTT